MLTRLGVRNSKVLPSKSLKPSNLDARYQKDLEVMMKAREANRTVLKESLHVRHKGMDATNEALARSTPDWANWARWGTEENIGLTDWMGVGAGATR